MKFIWNFCLAVVKKITKSNSSALLDSGSSAHIVVQNKKNLDYYLSLDYPIESYFGENEWAMPLPFQYVDLI